MFAIMIATVIATMMATMVAEVIATIIVISLGVFNESSNLKRIFDHQRSP